MTLKQAIQRARDRLQSYHIENPGLTVEVLLMYSLKINRVRLYQTLEDELNAEVEIDFLRLIERHMNGEPVAYITGRKEFFGIDFVVDNRVLIPRPETELLVDKALTQAAVNNPDSIADIGTGCGTVAVPLALKLPGVKIYATDISAAALEVAALNCREQGVADKINLLQGNLLEPLPEPVDMIIANLPYMRKDDITGSRGLSFEPGLALDGGEDGLSVIRQFCAQVKNRLKPNGLLLMEIGVGQGEPVTELLNKYFTGAVTINTYRDYAGIERVVQMTL